MGIFINEKGYTMNNNNQVTKLLETLEKEYNFYIELETLLKEERDCLISFDNEKLTELNFKKESLLLNIIEIKNQREKIITEISNELNVPIESINLTSLSNNIPEYKETFSTYKERFKKIGKKIKSLNEINEHVINSSLNFIKSSLNIIYQSVNRTTYSSYGKITGNSYYGKTAFYTGKV